MVKLHEFMQKPESRWSHSINARLYGADTSRLDLSVFTTLAAVISGSFHSTKKNRMIQRLSTMQTTCINYFSFLISFLKTPNTFKETNKSIQFSNHEHLKQNPKKQYIAMSENSLVAIMSLNPNKYNQVSMTLQTDMSLALQVISKQNSLSLSTLNVALE